MKKKWIKMILLTACFILMHEQIRAKNEKGSDVKIFIETSKKIVNGFPVILRITAYGKQRVPNLSIFDETALINVIFTSKKNGFKYTISSTRGQELLMTTAKGIRNDSIARQMFETFLSQQEKRTMLLDLASLRAEVGKSIILEDIPQGQYSVSVEFPSSRKTSNAIDIEILPPSKKELEYLQNVQKVGILKRGKGVNWSKLLRDCLPIPENNISELSIAAQDQLRFHLLLSKVLRSKVSIEKAKSIQVQEYLTPEKKCLLLVLEKSSDKKQNLVVNEKVFEKKYPGLKWRLYNFKKNNSIFLRYKKIRGRH